MTNPPHLTEDPSADDECPPLVAAQHQELPMPVEKNTRCTCSQQKIDTLLQRYGLPSNTTADKLLDMIIAGQETDTRRFVAEYLKQQLVVLCDTPA